MSKRQGVGRSNLEDPGAMLALFQDTLRMAGGEPPDIRSCEISYVRQSPMRWVFQYRLQIAHPETGKISAQEITGVTYGPERTEEQWASALESDPYAQRAIGPFGLPAITFVPELDLILQTLPYDYRLPGLIRVVEGTPELVAILFADVAEGNWVVESWRSHIARYRPDMRAMVRVDLLARKTEDDTRERRRTYAKVYRLDEQGEHAYRLLTSLEAQTANGRAAFSVARPIDYIENLRTILLREAPGERLLQIVRRGRQADAEAAIRRAARAVASMHQVSLPEGLLEPVRKEKREHLLEVSARLVRQNPTMAPAIEELVTDIVRQLDDGVTAPTHGDLKLGHVLIHGEQATILDFDKMALGDPLTDVANLVATLDAERERNADVVERRAGFAEAFVEEYFAHAPASWQSRFPVHFALATLVEAGTTGRGQRGRPGQQNRAPWVEAAIERARDALQGNLW